MTKKDSCTIFVECKTFRQFCIGHIGIEVAHAYGTLQYRMHDKVHFDRLRDEHMCLIKNNVRSFIKTAGGSDEIIEANVSRIPDLLGEIMCYDEYDSCAIIAKELKDGKIKHEDYNNE